MNKRVCKIAVTLGCVLFHFLLAKAYADPPMRKLEASFELPDLQGNPFDCVENDVEVDIVEPGGKHVMLPAFYDGGITWRVRHAARAIGRYTIESITINGKSVREQNLSRAELTIDQLPSHGFIRIDPKDPLRFAFDNGGTYYPVGYNLAWHQDGKTPIPPLTESLARMGRARVNWTRIWMNSWDDKNLDWSRHAKSQPAIGQLDLAVARHWDDIINAAETNKVYLQLVLQHHGQVNTRNDTNWSINPWNKSNGGWLASPVDFFSDPRARALTKSKLRYIVARWGYSTAIMSWELFNEVQSTDAYRSNVDLVASWHQEMADCLRKTDSYHHLITTSSNTTEPRLWVGTDYYQAHTYPSDMLAAIADLDSQQLKKPYFFGEFGGPNSDAASRPQQVLHQGLWASLMSRSSGAAQYWFWYLVEPEDLLGQFTSVQKFIDLTDVPNLRIDPAFPVQLQTEKLAPLKIGPGLDWVASRSTHFVISPTSGAESLSGMSAFLQGQSDNRAMFPSANFEVEYTEPGEFVVHLDQIAANGAKLELLIDGKSAASLSLAGVNQPSPQLRRSSAPHRIDASLGIPVSKGKHVIVMNNSGADWIHISSLTLSPYTSGLGALAKGNDQACVMWIYKRDTTTSAPITGRVSLPTFRAGRYQIIWWDTDNGQTIKQESKDSGAMGGLEFDTLPIASDVAVFIHRGEHESGFQH